MGENHDLEVERSHQNLKRSLEESENDSSNKLAKRDLCVCGQITDKLSKLEEQLSKNETSNKLALDSINVKVDKLIRLFGEIVEKEAKMTKNLAVLSKLIEKQEEQAKPSAQKSMGVFLQNLNKPSNGEEAKQEPKTNNRPVVVEKPKPVNELDELRWGQNTFLLGDGLINAMLNVPDIKDKIDKMKKALQLSLRAKDRDTIGKLYDRSRDKLLFPLPNKVARVILSVGSQDLFDESLVTLKQASLEEVKQKNKSKLKEKAGHIKAMIQKLINMGVHSVVYIAPSTSVQRKEIFQHFEEVVEEVLDDLPFPQFKLLSFPQLMYFCILFTTEIQMFPSRRENVLSLPFSLQTVYHQRVQLKRRTSKGMV